MKPLTIAIAGCGPAGLAAALMLHRLGHQVTMFERFETPRPLGSGLMLQPTGMAVLSAMQLMPQIAQHGARIDALLGLQEHGRPALDSPYDRLRREAFGMGIHRASLFGVLYDEVLAEHIPIRTGSEIAGSVDDRSGRHLVFADQSQSEPFDLIVDGMGWHSPLGDQSVGMLDFGALWATLPITPDDPVQHHLLEQRYRRAAQMVGVLPIGRRDLDGPQEVAFFWSLRGDRHQQWVADGLDRWKADVRALWPEIDFLLERISDSDQLTFARYAHRTAPGPQAHRFIHIGDAWHCASPQLGQGANMALLDAWSLARGLEQGRSLDEGLRLAAAWRSDHVKLYQLITWFFTPLYQSDSTWAPALRDRMLMPMSRFWPGKPLQAQIMSGVFGYPLSMLGLDSPDYGAIAHMLDSGSGAGPALHSSSGGPTTSSMAERASSLAQS